MRTASPVVLATVLTAVTASCGSEEGAPASAHEVLDSAGVRIVVNGPDAPVRIVLAGDPILALPVAAGEDVSLYRVEGGVILPGGGFVLANSGNHEVLYFGADGTFERRFGREGDGPGEFRGMTWMEATGDGGVTLADSRNRRLTTLGPDGTLARERRFAPTFDESALPTTAITAAGFAVSVLSDGRVIGFPRAFALPTGSRGPLPLQGDFAVYPADSLSANTAEPIGRRTVFEWYEDPGQQGFPVASMLQGARIWWGGYSGRLALTESSSPRIEVFDESRLTLVIRERRARAPFTPDSIPASYAVAADSLPAYQDLRVDGLHRIWARLTADEDPAVWRVFDESGTTLLDVALPGDARVLDADEGRLLLLRRDSLDVESVAVHGWTIPGG
ncbi:MAG: hypothetical protein LC667_07985 [Thioalkalivibrio sp.]|nr:hypothetical protein [Thioalkalivibrio sp.]